MTIDVLPELEWRGLVHQVTDPSLGPRLRSERMTLYCGFDPTFGSLHVGSLLPLTVLRRMQLAGHQPIVILGGGTGLIGDPSGKQTERALLTKEQLDSHIVNIRKQVESFLQGAGTQVLLLNNADWLSSLSLIEFLREIGKHFTVNVMMQKESIRARLESREQGISFTEFSYLLLQAYDFLHLFDSHGCRLQIGGSDQWGNITAGIDLIRRLRGEQAYGLTMPLLTRADGTKFGKTEQGSVWLDPTRTSPYQFYQYWIRVTDAEVIPYLKMFTFLERGRIEELEKQVAAEPARREAHKVLAWEVTGQVHGEAEARKARQASQALFGTEISRLDEATLLEVVEDAPSTVASRSVMVSGCPLVDLVVQAGLASSKSAARTEIQSGGVYVNNVRETDMNRLVTVDDLLLGKYLLLRRGRKTYHLFRFE